MSRLWDLIRRRRLVVAYVGFLGLLLGSLIVFAFVDGRRQRETLEERFLQGAAELFEERVTNWVGGQYRSATLAAVAVSAFGGSDARGSPSTGVEEILAEAAAGFPFREFAFVPPSGPLVRSGPAIPAVPPALVDRIEAGDTLAVGWLHDDDALDLFLAVPVPAPPGADGFGGTLISFVDPDGTLFSQFVRWSNMETTEASLVLPADGRVVAATLRGLDPLRIRSRVLEVGVVPPTWLDEAPQTVTYGGVGGDSLLGLSRGVAGTPWRVALEVARWEAMEPHRRRVRIAGGFAVALALIVGFVSLAVHRTAEVAGLRRAAAAERRLSTVLDGVVESILITSADGRITRVNEAASKLFDQPRDALVGRDLLQLLDGIDEADVSPDTGHAQRLLGVTEPLAYRRGSTVIPLEGSVATVRVGEESVLVYVFRDVTHRLELQAARREAERLQSLEYLTAGIAHDFNNLLATITLCAETLKLEEDLAPAERRKEAAGIKEAASRAADLTDNLLAFAGRARLRTRPLDLAAFVRSRADDLEARAPSGVKIRFETEGSPPVVEVDPERLNQVLRELLDNAVEAVSGDGTVTVQVREGPDADGRSCVHLSVTDDGVGMDPDTLERSREPFFTTKEFATRSGLGLSTAHGLVRQMNGMLTLDSQEGSGTRVTVTFPVEGEG